MAVLAAGRIPPRAALVVTTYLGLLVWPPVAFNVEPPVSLRTGIDALTLGRTALVLLVAALAVADGRVSLEHAGSLAGLDEDGAAEAVERLVGGGLASTERDAGDVVLTRYLREGTEESVRVTLRTREAE